MPGPILASRWSWSHSNAGVFVPVIERGLVQPVACSVFADATVSVARGHTPTAGEEFLPFLRSLTDPDGLCPGGTDWWDEDDVAPMFPSPQAREVITGEQPRLPLAYYQEQVPAPAGWDDHSCRYLLFSPAYQDQARQARQRGWPVQSLPGDAKRNRSHGGRGRRELVRDAPARSRGAVRHRTA